MGPPFLIYYLAFVLKWKHGVTLIETLKYIHIFCTRSYLYRDKVGFDFNQIISALWDREGEGLLLVNQHFIDIIFRCTHCNSVFCLISRIIHTVKKMTSLFLARTTCQACLHILFFHLIKVVELTSHLLSSLELLIIEGCLWKMKNYC